MIIIIIIIIILWMQNTKYICTFKYSNLTCINRQLEIFLSVIETWLSNLAKDREVDFRSQTRLTESDKRVYSREPKLAYFRLTTWRRWPTWLGILILC